jgi:hypothetical protein
MNRAEYVTKLVAVSDALFVTYYPFIPGTFMVADPGVIHADIDNIFSLYPNKNLYLAEVGYPSGVENGSSQKKQADFVRELFSVLDRYPKRIPGMNYLWLNDLSSQAVSDYAVYYGTPNKYFVSFLSSLGLKTYNGEAKLGFNAFQEEIDKRR